ncbi:NimA-like Ser/Thr protein kinase [Encephalitozoon intestinalis ATCC 50506]|uniref:non-specific serine/threonine protein kinase n=1 Tax=Encephalitozoon intestinalis (strain ATCC 50506) TaxID=876142 RepID=E0SA16_ENCIT|nr:NimA-like Ser/Thr protein kinase [Encephalitozoon intestinalis ATCC 50506]ADM12638.1 NimA-like Ser/Thr protein kinase [Encephalitozoon intestinalis ATCC 50506]UTX46498.1 death-associated protein kinase 1 [Encephalitozoon intestinalis]
MRRFRFIQKLSRGVHGTVYLLETTDSKREKVVCKSVLWRYRKHAENEARILSSISYKRIVKLIDFFPSDFGLFIVLEYMDCGSLDEMMIYFMESNFRATDRLAWSVLTQIAGGLRYLHSKKIIHRDLKPSNILANRARAEGGLMLEFKLCDFSVSKKLGKDGQISGIAGTPSYMAPEMVSGRHYTTSVDIWSLGVSIYELLALKKPFEGKNRNELFEMIKQAKLPQEMCKDMDLERLIRRCLSKKNRISARDICNYRKSDLTCRCRDKSRDVFRNGIS